MSEQRLKSLEEKQDSTKIILDSLVKSQAKIELAFNTLASDLKANHEDAKQHEQTLRNLDESLKALTLQLERSKLDGYKEINTAMHPVYNMLRKVESDISLGKTDQEKRHNITATKVERRVQYQATAVVVICWTLLGVIYKNIKDDVDANKKFIVEQHYSKSKITSINNQAP